MNLIDKYNIVFTEHVLKSKLVKYKDDNIFLKIAEWDNAMADLICRDFTINSERGE